MSALLRKWEVSFFVGISSAPHDFGSPSFIRLYGETVDALRDAVSDYLKAYKPAYFDNNGDHIVGRKMYAYSNGQQALPHVWQVAMEDSQESYNRAFKEQVGWWEFSTRLVSGYEKVYELRPYPTHLGDFEDAIGDFVTTALVPRKGPEYKSRALVDNQLQLPLLETVLREGDDYSHGMRNEVGF